MSGQAYHVEPDAITRGERERVRKFTRWQCPECDEVYDSPLPAVAVTCGRTGKHQPSKSIAMKPVTK